MDILDYKKYEPICEKWYLTKEIGRGSFGVVFEAERRDMIKPKSAIKIVSIPSSQSEVESFRQDHYTLDEKSVTSYFYGFVEEFLKEVEMMALFQDHQNIVGIRDYEVKQRQDEIGWDIFIRMELLTPVNKYFAENGITEDSVIKFGIDMCSALEECKNQNIIHRDIKPSNIFVSSNGDFKLGDFGVARTLEKTSSGFSKKGTYTYMAPEVYKGEEYDASIDIYSLGIVMYKMLNNNLEPFKKENTFDDEEMALIRRMRGEKIVEYPANSSKALADIILKACSYNPENRFRSPTDMKISLEKLIKCSDTSNSSTEAENPIIKEEKTEVEEKVVYDNFNVIKEEQPVIENVSEVIPPLENFTQETQTTQKGVRASTVVAWVIWIIISVVAVFSLGILGVALSAVMLSLVAYGEYLMRSGKNKTLGRIIVFVVPMLVGFPMAIFCAGVPVAAAAILLAASFCSCLGQS